MAGVVGMTGIAGVVGASTAIDAAGAVMQGAEAASAAVTSAMIPPSADPGSATAAVQMSMASAEMSAKSVVAFAGVEALSQFLKSQALAHSAADVVGTAALGAV